MERAWEVYRGALRPNNKEVIAAPYEAHVLGIEDLQTYHLDQAVWVLWELGAEEKADDLMDRFFARVSPIETYSSYPFKEMLKDNKFSERWKDEAEREVPDERTLDETIERYYNDKSNAMDDFKRLAQFSEDQFYDWFRTTTNPRVLSVASALSHIRYRLPLAITEIETIEGNVLATLRRISGKNKISEIRFRSLFANEARGQGSRMSTAPGRSD
jgi:hypothetical protein